MPKRRMRLFVHGVVQGVFFRVSTREQAVALGLRGLVRNLPDGSVEVVAEGHEAALLELIKWCKRGPPGARVSSIVEEPWEDARDEFATFRIAR